MKIESNMDELIRPYKETQRFYQRCRESFEHQIVGQLESDVIVNIHRNIWEHVNKRIRVSILQKIQYDFNKK